MLAHQLLSTDGTPVHNPLYQFWRVPLTTTRNWNINTSVQPLTFTLALLSARSLGRRRRVSPLLNDLKANKGAQVSRLNPYLSNWNTRKRPAKMANLSAPWDNTSIALKILEWSCCTALTNHYLTLMLFLLYCTPSPLPPPPLQSDMEEQYTTNMFFIYIYWDEVVSKLAHLCHFFVMGSKLYAVATPRGVEIDDPRILTVDNIVHECLIIQLRYKRRKVLECPAV